MIKATLVIMRHGQTVDNLQEIMTGQREAALTPLGMKQASAAGKYLRRVPFNKVYSSPLSRAFNTAALALKSANQNLPIEKRVALIEIDAGDFTGLKASDPDVKAFRQKFDTHFPGGESSEDVLARVRKFYEVAVLPRLKTGENVLIVAHAGVADALRRAMGDLDIPPAGAVQKRKDIPNAAPLICEYEDGIMKKSCLIIPMKHQPPKSRSGVSAPRRKELKLP